MVDNILNEGMIVGDVVDSVSGGSIPGATAILTAIRRYAGTPQIRLYDMSGVLSDTVTADADSDGVFVLGFQWDPSQLPNIIEDNPIYHLSVIGPTPSDAQLV